MFTRGDPNAPDDRGPSMMQRHAESRAREAAHAANAYLRREFPSATDATLALALDAHDGDAQLAKDALREFFDAERAGRTTAARGAGSSGRDGSDDDSRSGRRRHKKRKKHKKSSKSSKRGRASRRRDDDDSNDDDSDDDSDDAKKRKPERCTFGDDEAERRREIALAREKEAAAKQRAVVDAMRARGAAPLDGLREQELLRAQLQIAHRVGDVREVERIKSLLAEDDALERAAKDNYGFRANA